MDAALIPLPVRRTARLSSGERHGGPLLDARLLALIAVALSMASPASAHPPDPALPAAFYPDEDAEIRAGEALGLGTVKLEGPAVVEVDSHQSLALVYTAGPAGIVPGGGVRIGMIHAHRWTVPQTGEPGADGYLTVVAPHGCRPEITIEDDSSGSRLFSRHHPWQNIVEVVLPGRGLEAGETLTVTYGDRSGGSQGIRVQPFDEAAFAFKISVDARGDGEYLPLRDRPALEIVAAEPERLTVIMPSDAVAGQPTWCIVRAEDRFGNPAAAYRGTVGLSTAQDGAELPGPRTFTAADRGVYRFEGIVFETPGPRRLRADDGDFSHTGNPVRVAAAPPERLLLWGDLHGHTLASDGRGTVEAFYDFAERVAGLDFCAVTDHGFLISDAMWQHSKRVTNAAYRPGRFVTFQAYEWSGMTENGGDHNVYFLGDDPPLLRSRSYHDPRNPRMYQGPIPQTNHVEDLFSTLASDRRRQAGPPEVFVIPHWGGRRANPTWHRPALERLIELFSEHGRKWEWAEDFLRRGYRLGIMASTDNHFGNPGYGYLRRVHDWNRQEIGMATVAVYAHERTREAIFQALYDRRVYATTGERIVLEVDAGGHPMGSVLAPGEPPRLRVRVMGTAAISRVEIRKNGEVVHSEAPGAAVAELTWRDPRPGLESYYYVRVVQADGEEAVSSPVWVTGPGVPPAEAAGEH